MKRLNLRLFRIKHNLSQNQLADILNVGRSTYNDIENGKRDGSILFFKKLQKKFDISDEEIWQLTKKEGE